jgi:hypothetical protein
MSFARKEILIMIKKIVPLLIGFATLSFPLAAIAGGVYEGQALNPMEGDMDAARIVVEPQSGTLEVTFAKESNQPANFSLTADQLVNVSVGDFERTPGFMDTVLSTGNMDFDARQFLIDYRNADGEMISTRLYVNADMGQALEADIRDLIDYSQSAQGF